MPAFLSMVMTQSLKECKILIDSSLEEGNSVIKIGHTLESLVRFLVVTFIIASCNLIKRSVYPRPAGCFSPSNTGERNVRQTG